MKSASYRVHDYRLQITLLQTRRAYSSYLRHKQVLGGRSLAKFIAYKQKAGECVFYQDHFSDGDILHELTHFVLHILDPRKNEEKFVLTLQECFDEVIEWKKSTQ